MRPHVLNCWIAGYQGYLGLQDLAAESRDPTIEGYLTETKAKRLAHLNDVDPLDLSGYESGGFLWLVPELADYLRQHAQQRVQHYLDRYDWALPYWSVSRAPECTRVSAQITLDHMEGGHAPYYDTWGLFNAKALILRYSRSELEDLLDVPAVSRGDLFYIHNLVSTIEAR